jgi:hypothetical protein
LFDGDDQVSVTMDEEKRRITAVDMGDGGSVDPPWTKKIAGPEPDASSGTIISITVRLSESGS